MSGWTILTVTILLLEPRGFRSVHETNPTAPWSSHLSGDRFLPKSTLLKGLPSKTSNMAGEEIPVISHNLPFPNQRVEQQYHCQGDTHLEQVRGPRAADSASFLQPVQKGAGMPCASRASSQTSALNISFMPGLVRCGHTNSRKICLCSTQRTI